MGHAHAALGRLAAAEKLYQQALALRRELSPDPQVMDTLAGLAHLHFVQGHLTQARTQLEEILTHLDERKTLDGTAEPFRIYWTCYLVLRGNEDSRASTILADARRLLVEQADRIDDEELRRSFLRTWRPIERS
jgi:Asp-tRNA(Asn)/Glu-tRNA(Gln) amidotransferase C subunit